MDSYEDNLPSSRFPFATYGIIGLQLILYIYMVMSKQSFSLIVDWGFIPRSLVGDPFGSVGRMLTHQFVNPGFVAFLGSLLFFWIFCEPVESSIGTLKTIAFFFTSGMIGAMFVFVCDPMAISPLFGMVSSVSGLIILYFVIYPDRGILLNLFYFKYVNVPAIIFAIIWVVIQPAFALEQFPLVGFSLPLIIVPILSGLVFGAIAGNEWYRSQKKQNILLTL